jgi:ABC-type uncharacterized transport system ATPase subunit
LTVQVPEVKGNCFNCLDNPVGFGIQEYLGTPLQQRDGYYAVQILSGIIGPGKLGLFLGSNKASMSTLIRALCGRFNQRDDLYGTVLLNGMPMGEANQGWRRLSPYVPTSDKSHSSVLTVAQTIQFAVQCTRDGFELWIIFNPASNPFCRRWACPMWRRLW